MRPQINRFFRYFIREHGVSTSSQGHFSFIFGHLVADCFVFYKKTLAFPQSAWYNEIRKSNEVIPMF